MKIRRALATAAATAVIVPAALLAAPAAYATDDTSASPTAGDTSTPDPAESESTPAGDPSESESDPATEPSDNESSPATGPSAPEPSGSASASSEPSPSSSETDEPEDECRAADFTSSLSGFPNKVVAGSGWKEFTLNLDNSEGEDLESVVIGASVVYKNDLDSDGDSDTMSKFAGLQYFDGEKWSSDLSDGGSIGGWLDVAAGEKLSLKLRLSIGAKAPAGSAVGIAFGVYTDEEDCYLDENWYEFEVLAAGTAEPGDVGHAEPQGGKNPVDVKPTGDVEKIEGALAETGSSSALPTVAALGGTAMVVGAGAFILVRRRKAAGGEAAA
ncbi:LPXTG cell wall anchor domain-containing protein [Streptomyces sp. NPDC048639]|uniref:LPXTG cell wall anchor domain-containing protein n=1 Tax=Streptomyces sp. NPDC048639 TaxID=3365581 RepID=UPI00371E6827